ncbi:HAD family hydrolase [Aerococcus urinae]|uniref:HAD family hydrolase n=1 Tax=Aerococcus urinae TaxID=1376 RepID=UPI00254E61B1|nr:HAD family hydrolase [Aerococcus urinae]MDK6371098.1 HAD family hydrolase [Aerococcus urinae]
MKLIAIDMDDTLLTSSNNVSKSQNEYIINFLDEHDDYAITIATGRPIQGIDNKLSLELINRLYYIALNGAIVLGTDNQIVDIKYLNNNIIQDILMFAEKNKYELCVMDESNYYVLSDDPSDDVYYDAGLNGMEPISISSEEVYSLKYVTKILLYEKPENILATKELIPEFIQKETSIILSQPYLIEFLPKNIDKLSAFKLLADHLKVKVEDTFAIGDGLNDLTLLQGVGCSIAMSNSNEKILEIANYVTSTNDDDGVSKALENIINGTYVSE